MIISKSKRVKSLFDAEPTVQDWSSDLAKDLLKARIKNGTVKAPSIFKILKNLCSE